MDRSSILDMISMITAWSPPQLYQKFWKRVSKNLGNGHRIAILSCGGKFYMQKFRPTAQQWRFENSGEECVCNVSQWAAHLMFWNAFFCCANYSVCNVRNICNVSQWACLMFWNAILVPQTIPKFLHLVLLCNANSNAWHFIHILACLYYSLYQNGWISEIFRKFIHFGIERLL